MKGANEQRQAHNVPVIQLRRRSEASCWRGNVRELRTLLKQAIVESDGHRLMLERAAEESSGGAEPEPALQLYDEARKELDRRYYTALYHRFDGNLSKIAKAAGKQRVTVREVLRRLGLRAR